MLKPLLIACGVATAVTLTAGLAPGVAAKADAAPQFKVAFTKIGIFPRVAPSMDAVRIGQALPDGTVINVACEQEGQSVTSSVATSNVWMKLSTPTGSWLPNAFVETGVTSKWTPGLPRCLAATPTPAPKPTTSGTNVPKHYDGKTLAYTGPLYYALWDHYIWGKGETVILDWSLFKSDPAIVKVANSAAKPYGVESYTAPLGTDLFFALGTFGISRTSDRCFAVTDDYDFNPDKPSNVPYIAYWSYQLGGARNFKVRASGCL